MKNLTKGPAAARPCGRPAGPLALLLITLLLPGLAAAQTKGGDPALKELSDRIAALDAAMFAAYNACDIDKVGAYFTEDLEFYHEKGGVTHTRNASLDIMRKNLCGGDNRVRRELVRESLEVRPINNYGAVQTGEHRFYLTQKGRQEKLDGVCKFVMLWQQKGGEWRISRVVSYGCRPPE